MCVCVVRVCGGGRVCIRACGCMGVCGWVCRCICAWAGKRDGSGVASEWGSDRVYVCMHV